MGRYKKGEHVKIEVKEENSSIGEWLWLLVEESDDERQLVVGRLDNEPIANSDLKLGQLLAVSYDRIKEHRRII